jgi:SAM-dependent methyltransferase
MISDIVQNTITKHFSSKEIDIVNIKGSSYIILKNVFNPTISPSGKIVQNWFSNNQKLFKNKSILDYGCGSGIPTCQFGQMGAEIVFANDISPEAIKNTKINIILSKQSSKIKTIDNIIIIKPDIIFANLPAIDKQTSSLFEKAFFDYKLETTTNLLYSLRHNQNWQKSVLYLVYFQENIDLLLNYIEVLGLKFEIDFTQKTKGIEAGIMKVFN